MDADAEQKYTNEQGVCIPLLQLLGDQIINKTLTADALLTTREITQHIVANGAHYVCTVKGNQPNLQEAVTYYFEDLFKRNPQAPADFVSRTGDDDPRGRRIRHGRHEIRKIWTTDSLNGYLAEDVGFPTVGQVFAIHRTRITYKEGKVSGTSHEWDYGITSHSPESADAESLLRFDRGQWSIEVMHRQLDEPSTYDEDRCRIRTGNGPENFSTLRRFAIAVVRRHHCEFAPVLRRLARNSRLMLDYLCLTANTNRRPAQAA